MCKIFWWSQISEMKIGKAAGQENLRKLIKLMDKKPIDWLIIVLNNVRNMSQILWSWYKCTFITLLKEPNARKCKYYRIIALMSNPLKVFLKVMLKRIYRRSEEHCLVFEKPWIQKRRCSEFTSCSNAVETLTAMYMYLSIFTISQQLNHKNK